MNVSELAKKLGKTAKQVIAEIDDPRVTHHKHIVPESIASEFFIKSEKKTEDEAEPTATVDTAETVVIPEPEPAPVAEPEPVVKEDKPEPIVNLDDLKCPFTLEEIELGCRSLGNKGPQYKWKHLLNG